MCAYHQQGHRSNNLILEPKLRPFEGVILSPVNYTKPEMSEFLNEKNISHLNFIFDPQLYVPRSPRKVLRSWDYFPEKFESLNLPDTTYWNKLISQIRVTRKDVPFSSVCSPAIFPTKFSLSYYSMMVNIANETLSAFDDDNTHVYCTTILDINDLNSDPLVDEILSVITKFSGDNIYLIFYDTLDPKVQQSNVNSLINCMKLIHILAENGYNILVGYSGIESLLWRYAGANACATGKFLNLRRFSTDRFEEKKDGGGGQSPYFVDCSFLTYFRDADYLRLTSEKLLPKSVFDYNPYAKQILEKIPQGEAWVGDSWRFYLYWFMNVHSQISNNPSIVKDIVDESDAMWGKIEDEDFLFEDRFNTGKWIRSWRIAIKKFDKLK
jgi:hypothetical protein